MKKFWLKVKYFINSIFYGLASADHVLMGGNNGEEGITINQEVQDKRVSKDLLKGELTQEVEELRYRTIKVDRESKGYEYFSPTLAKKKDINDTKFIHYENGDNLEVVTIQPNEYLTANLRDAMLNINSEDVKDIQDSKGNTEISVNVGEFKQEKKYNIKIKRSEYSIPRYYLEEYTTRLVVKKTDEENKYVLDFYVSKYPNVFDYKSKGFVREIEQIKDEGWKSDIIDFNGVNFVTSHAYLFDDMVEFDFKHPIFQKIVEYDGHYVIKFKATLSKLYDKIKDVYSKTMDEKYQNKVAKDVVYDITGGHEKVVYKCEVCGKEVVYDTLEIDTTPIQQAREIDEEIENDNTNQLTSYLDIQMSEQTTGKKMCRKCFKEWLKNNNIEYSNIYANK